MKPTLIVLVAALAGACGGGGGSGTSTAMKNLANFEGAAWTGPLTVTQNCAGNVATAQGQASITLLPGSDTDLQFSTLPGCTFKFNVSGNTATLANGPVSCSGTDQGVPFTTTVTRYTLVTTDGHNMSVDTAATVLTGGQNCSLALAGTLKR